MTAPPDDGTGAGDDTLSSPTPAWIEQQRQSALTALAVARQAVRNGMLGTAETKLLLVESFLRAMVPGAGR